uniref:Uncharacterized protein n=1 Tax=Arundo donax TaxID=35708 RepID=A0A0A9HGJ8_ARUDO
MVIVATATDEKRSWEEAQGPPLFCLLHPWPWAPRPVARRSSCVGTQPSSLVLAPTPLPCFSASPAPTKVATSRCCCSR